MKLRFKVDQAEALRQGVDAPTSVVTIEINPKTLTQEERNLLADRMGGIDVYELTTWTGVSAPGHSEKHITATQATFDALMASVRANEARIQAKKDDVAQTSKKQPKRKQFLAASKLQPKTPDTKE